MGSTNSLLVAGSGRLPEGCCRTLQICKNYLRPLPPALECNIMGPLAMWRCEQRRPPSRVAYIMLTSGSTGKPRAVHGTLEGATFSYTTSVC